MGTLLIRKILSFKISRNKYYSKRIEKIKKDIVELEAIYKKGLDYYCDYTSGGLRHFVDWKYFLSHTKPRMIRKQMWYKDRIDK